MITTGYSEFSTLTTFSQPAMISKNSIPTLTAIPTPFILTPLSQKTKVGISTPRKGEQSPLSLTVFLCPVKSDTGLIRVAFVMVDCLRESVTRFTRTFSGSTNLIQSATQCLVPKGGGIFSKKGVSAMNTVVQLSQYRKPALAVSPPVSPDLPILANRLEHIIQYLEFTQNRAHSRAKAFRTIKQTDCAIALAEEFDEFVIDLTVVLNVLRELCND